MEQHLIRKLASFAFIGLSRAAAVARETAAWIPAIGQAQAVTAAHGMVVAQEAMAARIGADILQEGRQRGRRRGRGRLRAGRDLSARRQYRRRRLHGDPSRRRRRATTPPSTIARPRRRRSTTNRSSTRRAMPIRRSRATPRSPSACRARSRGWRWRSKNTARASFTLADLMQPAIALARDGIRGRRRHRGFAAPRPAAARALAVVGADLSESRRQRRSRPATGWCSPISPTRWKRSPKTGRARSIKARSRKSSPPPCKPPAA